MAARLHRTVAARRSTQRLLLVAKYKDESCSRRVYFCGRRCVKSVHVFRKPWRWKACNSVPACGSTIRFPDYVKMRPDNVRLKLSASRLVEKTGRPRYSKLAETWLEHLLLNSHAATTTQFISVEKTLSFSPLEPDSARQQLQQVLDCAERAYVSHCRCIWSWCWRAGRNHSQKAARNLSKMATLTS